jgi:hypothetical protein
MKIYFTFERESEFDRFSRLITEIGYQLNKHCLKGNYGYAVDALTIGIILVNSRPGYEKWFKERPVRFKEKQVQRNHLNQLVEINKRLTYDIKFDDNELLQMKVYNDTEFLTFFLKKLITSFEKFNKLPKAAVGFQHTEFVSDILNGIVNIKI